MTRASFPPRILRPATLAPEAQVFGMCGLAGSRGLEDEPFVRGMMTSLAHRGLARQACIASPRERWAIAGRASWIRRVATNRYEVDSTSKIAVLEVGGIVWAILAAPTGKCGVRPEDT